MSSIQEVQSRTESDIAYQAMLDRRHPDRDNSRYRAPVSWRRRYARGWRPGSTTTTPPALGRLMSASELLALSPEQIDELDRALLEP